MARLFGFFMLYMLAGYIVLTLVYGHRVSPAGAEPAHQVVAGLLFLAAVAIAFRLSDRMFNLARPISKARACIGVAFFFLVLAAPMTIGTLRAIDRGEILFGMRRGDDMTFSMLHAPFGYWFTFSLYLALMTFFLAVTFQYTRHAISIFRDRPAINARKSWLG